MSYEEEDTRMSPDELTAALCAAYEEEDTYVI